MSIRFEHGKRVKEIYYEKSINLSFSKSLRDLVFVSIRIMPCGFFLREEPMGMKSKSNHFAPNGAGGPAQRVGTLRFLIKNLQLFAEFPKGESQMHHIMANRRGHLPNTIENRQIILSLTNDESNFVGYTRHGKKVYTKIENGFQYWAFVREGTIQDAGANRPGDYRSNEELLNGRKKR